jgi:hypothetical protein
VDDTDVVTGISPDIAASGGQATELPFRKDSAELAVVSWSMYGLLSLGCGAAAVVFLAQAVGSLLGQPAHAWDALCVSIGFGGGAAMLGIMAWPGLLASWAAHKRPGSVMIAGSHLVLQARGLLNDPARLERSWIKGMRDRQPWPTARMSRLTFALSKPSVVLEFSTPISFPTARGAPQLPWLPMPGPPAPWDEVESLVLVFEDPLQAASALQSWLDETAPTADRPAPTASAKPSGAIRRIAIPISVMVAGVLGLWAGILVSSGH